MNEIKNQCYYPQNLLLCKQTPSVVWYNPPTIMDFQSALRLFHNRCLRKSVRWDFVVGAWGLMPLALYHGITPGISPISIWFIFRFLNIAHMTAFTMEFPNCLYNCVSLLTVAILSISASVTSISRPHSLGVSRRMRYMASTLYNS